MVMALAGSGSELFSFRSAKMSAVAKGEEDQMMRTRGNVSVRRTSLDCTLCVATVASVSALCFCFEANLPVGFAYDLISATDYDRR